MKTTLTVEIEYDPAITDPEGLACAMDRLLETALSKPGILSEYGNLTVGEFFAAKEPTAPPVPKIVLNLSGGVLQDVFGSDSAIAVTLVDWDVEGCSPSDSNIVELPDVRGGTHPASVAEYPVWPLEQLAGTETEAALKAAGLALAPSADRTVTRRWVLYRIDTNSVLTTRTYESYDEAAEDASQVEDILVLPLELEELHAQPAVEDGDTVNELKHTRCECEEPGHFCSGVPGILAHMENGSLTKGTQVNRCDLCRRYPSDEAAFEKLRELGLVPS